ncbi:UNVERIFIED_CONTAM: hypothetical protein Sradi_0933200 [Sesamum radiatum]|uniref:Retrotransposon gag domain-containing protein n=1 Tax=Sesamum radiatum TaxID=300843 RepID=A0AAW2V2X5_SESRA
MPTKSIQALEEAITALSDRLLELHASMELRHDSLAAAVSDIQQHLTAIPSPVTSFSSPAALPPLPPPIPVSQRLDVISFYMKGEALSWFKWMFTNRQLSSWDAFALALKLRFGPSSFDNHQAVLFKLRQRGSVAEFQADFERNHVDVTPPPPPRPPALLAAPPSPPVTTRRLSPTELQERRTKGVCFNCDEKFGPGHRCKAKQFMLLLLDDPLNLFDTCPDSEDVPSSPEAAFTDGVLFQLSRPRCRASLPVYSLLSGLDSRAHRFCLN